MAPKWQPRLHIDEPSKRCLRGIYHEPWWTSCVQIRNPDAPISVNMSGKEMDDPRAKTWCSWFRTHVASLREAGTELREANDVNFAENELTSVGVSYIIKAFSDLGISIRVLKLYKNRIADACGLAQFIRNSQGALRELHLSHNKLDADGAVELLFAATGAEDECGASSYPRASDGKEAAAPLWLRLEQNLIDHKKALASFEAAAARKSSSTWALCDATHRHCKPQSCVWQGADTPAVHIPYFTLQRSVPSANGESQEDPRSEACDPKPIEAEEWAEPAPPKSEGVAGHKEAKGERAGPKWRVKEQLESGAAAQPAATTVHPWRAKRQPESNATRPQTKTVRSQTKIVHREPVYPKDTLLVLRQRLSDSGALGANPLGIVSVSLRFQEGPSDSEAKEEEKEEAAAASDAESSTCSPCSTETREDPSDGPGEVVSKIAEAKEDPSDAPAEVVSNSEVPKPVWVSVGASHVPAEVVSSSQVSKPVANCVSVGTNKAMLRKEMRTSNAPMSRTEAFLMQQALEKYRSECAPRRVTDERRVHASKMFSAKTVHDALNLCANEFYPSSASIAAEESAMSASAEEFVPHSSLKATAVEFVPASKGAKAAEAEPELESYEIGSVLKSKASEVVADVGKARKIARAKIASSFRADASEFVPAEGPLPTLLRAGAKEFVPDFASAKCTRQPHIGASALAVENDSTSRGHQLENNLIEEAAPESHHDSVSIRSLASKFARRK